MTATDAINFIGNNFFDTSLDHIPGDLGLPFVGDTLGLINDPLPLLYEKEGQYGRIFKFRAFGEPVVTLLGAEANRFVLVDHAEHLSSRAGYDVAIGDLFAGGLLLRDGADHLQHRNIMQAAFKKAPMVGYLEKMVPVVASYVEGWRNKSRLVVFPELKQLTLDVAGPVFFGLNFEHDLERVNKAIADIVAASMSLIHQPIPFTKYWYGMKGRAELQSFFEKVIGERRRKPTPDMLGQLCAAEDEHGKTFTDEEIRNHMIFLLMAAHDTTTSTVTSLCYELARNQDWQERLRQESVDFSAKGGFDFGRLKELAELGWAIKEALRLYPPLPVFGRNTIEDTHFGGYTIPAGVRIAVVPLHSHRMPEYWTNPDAFDPERFSDERCEHKKAANSYIPFGAGKHVCIGLNFAEMQAKVIMNHMLRNYRWNVKPGYVADYQVVPLQEPRDGLPIELTPID